MGKFLKVMSILCLVFGIIGLIGLVIVLASAGLLASLGQAVPVASTVIGIIETIILIVAGVYGLKASADPAKAGKAVVFGIILIALAIVSMAIGIAEAGEAGLSWMNFTGLIIPVLYLIAAILLKKKG